MSDAVYIGIGTPQANPTVEIEFRQLVRPPVHVLATRLTSSSPAPDERLVDYAEQLPRAVASFDSMPLSAFGFACTGSSYLLDPEREERLVAAAERESRVQIVMATQAIRRELEGRGARRIAMLCPYPQSLCDAAVQYWQRLGHDVVAVSRIDVGADTRAIYRITTDEVRKAIDAFDTRDADLLLLSGTGMPTLGALKSSALPAISSNLCLATELLRRVRHWPAAEAADIDKLLQPAAQAGV
ncbi:MAG: hypothetical protein R3288_02830 [Woeseiaceae bacterium]|nr:hypothetical protein [Woeseiaceae bacterium]